MITDMFAGSNQSVDFKAMISSLNAGNKVGKHNGENGNEFDSSLNFASLLSQTLDSNFSANPQSEILKNSVKDSVSSIDSTSFVKSSFNVSVINSSPLMNLSEPNSLQKSFYAVSKNITKNNNAANSEKTEQMANQDNKAIEKKQDDNTTQKASEVNESENTQTSETTEESNELELNFTAEEAEMLSVTEEATNIEDASIIVADLGETENMESEETTENSEDEEEISSKTNPQIDSSLFAQANSENVEMSKENNADVIDKTNEISETDNLQNHVVIQQQADDNQEIASNLTNENLENQDEKLAEAVSTEETEQVTSEEVANKEAKTEEKSEKESKLDEIVENLKENESVVPKESLREEFARLTAQDDHVVEDNPNGEMLQQNATGTEQQASLAAATANSTADEPLEKSFIAQSEKADGLESNDSKVHTAIAGQEGLAKSNNQNPNSSGGSNGFSFQSGSSQTYDANGKVTQTPSTPVTNFADLIEKAEMVKTKDGAKVMNIETEQEGFGKLELELVSKNGEVTAKLSAENEIAKVKLEELTAQIKDSLQEKGINLTQISVDVSSKNADSNSNEFLNSGKRNKSARIGRIGNRSASEIIKKNILPNLRRQALNIQSVDITV